MEGVCDKGKHRLGEGATGAHSQRKPRPWSMSTVNGDKIALRNLYHNPDPLFRLIGESNETKLIIENNTVNGFLDSGAQFSSISNTFAQNYKA